MTTMDYSRYNNYNCNNSNYNSNSNYDGFQQNQGTSRLIPLVSNIAPQVRNNDIIVNSSNTNNNTNNNRNTNSINNNRTHVRSISCVAAVTGGAATTVAISTPSQSNYVYSAVESLSGSDTPQPEHTVRHYPGKIVIRPFNQSHPPAFQQQQQQQQQQSQQSQQSQLQQHIQQQSQPKQKAQSTVLIKDVGSFQIGSINCGLHLSTRILLCNSCRCVPESLARHLSQVHNVSAPDTMPLQNPGDSQPLIVRLAANQHETNPHLGSRKNGLINGFRCAQPGCFHCTGTSESMKRHYREVHTNFKSADVFAAIILPLESVDGDSVYYLFKLRDEPTTPTATVKAAAVATATATATATEIANSGMITPRLESTPADQQESFAKFKAICKAVNKMYADAAMFLKLLTREYIVSSASKLSKIATQSDLTVNIPGYGSHLSSAFDSDTQRYFKHLRECAPVLTSRLQNRSDNHSSLSYNGYVAGHDYLLNLLLVLIQVTAGKPFTYSQLESMRITNSTTTMRNIGITTGSIAIGVASDPVARALPTAISQLLFEYLLLIRRPIVGSLHPDDQMWLKKRLSAFLFVTASQHVTTAEYVKKTFSEVLSSYVGFSIDLKRYSQIVDDVHVVTNFMQRLYLYSKAQRNNNSSSSSNRKIDSFVYAARWHVLLNEHGAFS
ncbi:hypothetical protein GQ42DRAFT_50496 [Ramicandelaber brevisporus]|nr:hypothetical protein GQ42DRAFT_50496 [Ramicandelaber brevisporus]